MSSLLTELFQAYIVEIASTAAAKASLKALGMLAALNPIINYRPYLLQLRRDLRDMPFIYKDLPGDVISDFVEADVGVVSPTRVDAAVATQPLTAIGADERIRRSRKLIFLGHPGIGKTTFFRHTVLSLSSRATRPQFLHSAEQPVPFYVPLKAVDNAESLPILLYLLANNPLLRHAGGLSRLVSLARRGRIFLFLDGYDEAPAPGAREKDFVVEELERLLGGEGLPGLRPPYAELYDSLFRARIWLSSRRDFFERYQLRISVIVITQIGRS